MSREWLSVWASSGEEAAGSQKAAAVVQQIPSAQPTVIRFPAGRNGRKGGRRGLTSAPLNLSWTTRPEEGSRRRSSTCPQFQDQNQNLDLDLEQLYGGFPPSLHFTVTAGPGESGALYAQRGGDAGTFERPTLLVFPWKHWPLCGNMTPRTSVTSMKPETCCRLCG
ncbi:hypothetical protein AMECASPLE_027738, partial [Ameca splendens]